MNIRDFFNSELKIKESYQLPGKLLQKLLIEDEKNKLFDNFLKEGFSVDIDTFNRYFEEVHGDRKNFMQDFTPSSITKLVEELGGKNKRVLDVCAGVGGLSQNLEADFLQLEELSQRALSVLLFVEAIKNRNAIIKNVDVLTGKTGKIYKLSKSDKYSTVEIVEDIEEDEGFDLIVSNPPYSLKWEPGEVIDIERYMHYDTAPKSKADYAFVIGQLSRLNEGGQMLYVFPHGILFRGGAEGKIRQKLIENNLIDTIIGLPGKMFTNTDIPTVLLVIKKDRKEKDILFVDASKEFEEVDKRNVFTDEILNKIITTVKQRLEVKRFSELADFEKIQDNDFNLNIPRYVDTYVPQPIANLLETVKELFKLIDEEEETAKRLFRYILELTSSDIKLDEELKEVQKMIRERWKDIETDGDL